MLMTQELMPLFDISHAKLVRAPGVYRVSVASSASGDKVLLSHLRDIQAYSPGRIQNVEVAVKEERLCITIEIHDETKPIPSSQVEIVRLCKRRCVT